MLACPYERTTDGDGTVPLSSQNALLRTPNSTAQPQDPEAKDKIITKGNVVHAKICEHPDAIDQTINAIAVLVKELRPKDQAQLYVLSPSRSGATRGDS